MKGTDDTVHPAGAKLRRIDPNDAPHAEPLSVPALLTVLVLTGVSTYFFLRLKIQAMHRPASRVTIREEGSAMVGQDDS